MNWICREKEKKDFKFKGKYDINDVFSHIQLTSDQMFF